MKQKPFPWTLIAMLCATATASYICRVNVSTAGALIMEEFHLSQSQMGTILSAFLVGYALFQVPAGYLADKIGARRVLTWAVLVWTLLTLVQAVVGSSLIPLAASSALIVFAAFRFLLGVTVAPTYPAAAQGVSQWVTPAFQGRANGIVISSIGLGSAITPLLVSNVMVAYGWRTALLASAIPALIVGLLWLRINPGIAHTATSAEAATKPKTEPAKSIWSRGFILLTLSYTLQGYVGYIFVTWFYLYLVQERHFGLISGAWWSSLPWVLSFISIPLGGFISDKLVSGTLGHTWGRRLIPVLGMALSGVLISIGAHTDNAIVAAIALAFATAFILCVEGPFWSVMISLAGKQSGTAGGIMNMGSNIGGFISPMLTPFLAAVIGWENALHVAASLAVVGALLWLGISLKAQAEIQEAPQTPIGF